MKQLLAIVMLLLPGSGGAQAQNWWEGIWSAKPEWCAAANHIGDVTPAPIEITRSGVRGYESRCSIAAARSMDRAVAVHLQLKCHAEGNVYDEDRLMMRTDETGLAVWIWFGSGDPVLFQRCE